MNEDTSMINTPYLCVIDYLHVLELKYRLKVKSSYHNYNTFHFQNPKL